MQRSLLFLACFFYCAFGIAQQYPFVNYTIKDGLANNRVKYMYEDSKGRLYIATYGGLSVYDGARFTNYTTDNGLAISLINEIREMGEDSLWIVLNTGRMQCMVRGAIRDIKFADAFCPVINQLLKCSDGFFYAIADEGLYRLNRDHFEKIKLTDESGTNEAVNLSQGVEVNGKLFLITDPNTATWPGEGSLIVYDIHTKKHLASKNLPVIYSITRTPYNDVLLSTYNGFSCIDQKGLEQDLLITTTVPPFYHLPQFKGSANIYFDHNKDIWILNSKGVMKLMKDGSARTYDSRNGLSQNAQVYFLETKENIVWLAAYQTGLNKLANQELEFLPKVDPGLSVNSIYIEPGTDSIWLYDAVKNKIVLYHSGEKKIYRAKRPSFFFKIFAAGGTLYLADYFDIYKVNLEGARFSTSLFYKEKVRSNGISCLLHDKEGNLIRITNNLTVVFKNGSTQTVPLGHLADQAALSKDNYLWIATRNKKISLYKIDPSDKEHYLQLVKLFDRQLPEMSPRSICVENNHVWIGTRDHGLYCFLFDGTKLQPEEQLTTQKGLSENFVSSLYCDPSNTIWACSPTGLDKVIRKNGRVYVENINRSNNIYQGVAQVAMTATGDYWALSYGGIMRFHSTKEAPAHYTPHILFTEIEAGNEPVRNSNKKLELDHTQNNLSFHIAAPTYYDERQTRFSYWLEGSGKNIWSDPSLQSEINLVNLSPGAYTLHVRARFLNGRYPEQTAAFSFFIHPPWWQTWWVRVIAVCTAMMIVLLFVRKYYHRKMEVQKTILERQRAIEQERSRISTDIHDDLGAGLSSIRFLGEKIKRNSFSEVTRQDIEKLQTTSGELMDKMNEIIWAINEKNDSLDDLLFYTRSYAKEYCEENGLSCTILLPDQIPHVFVSGEVRRNLFLIIKESLHNIVKHAYAKNVTIGITIDKKLEIEISDDGKGLSAPGYRMVGGNGFRNMQKRIRSIGGIVTIKNGQGVTVEMVVPI
jgi:signal transduction histidine kinase/ligand-binding sensor domain-containing protein